MRIPIRGLTVNDICEALDRTPVSDILIESLFLDSGVIAGNLDSGYCPGSTPSARLSNLRTKPYQIGKWRNYSDYVRMVVGYAYCKQAILDLQPPPGWRIPTSTDYYDIFNSMTLSGNFMYGNNSLGNAIKSEVSYSSPSYQFGWNTVHQDIFGFKLNRVPAVTKSRYPDGRTGVDVAEPWGSLGCIDGASVKYITVADVSDVIVLFELVDTVPVGTTKSIGVSLRYLKNDSNDPGYLEDYNGNLYSTVNINGFVLTSENIRSTRTKTGGELVLGDTFPNGSVSWLGNDSNIIGYSNYAINAYGEVI